MTTTTKPDVLLVTETDAGYVEHTADDMTPSARDTLVELEDAIGSAKQAKEELKRAEAELAEWTEKVAKLAESIGASDHFAVAGQWTRINRTYQRRFNLHLLRQRLNGDLFDAVTSPKIDTPEYDRQRALGMIDDTVDAEVVTVTARRPYLTFGRTSTTKESA